MKKKKCDCWRYEHQVCDICQKVVGKKMKDKQNTYNFTKKFKKKKNFKAVLDPKVRIKYGHENKEEIIVDFTDLMKTLKELGMLKK